MKSKQIFIFLIISLLLITTQSCMRMELLVHVKKNGSGTLDLKYSMSSDLITSLQGMAGEEGRQAESSEEDEEQTNDTENMFNKEYFENESNKFSSDIKLISYEEIRDEKNIGGQAVYSFSNINDLNTSLTPSASYSSPGQDTGNDSMEFSLKKKGRKRFLTITMDENNSFASNLPASNKTGEEKSEEDEEALELQLNMIQTLLKDMFISFKVSVDGKITYCNSDYVEENVVTILEADFNKIFENEEAVKNTGSGKKVDGLKFTNVTDIVIEFE